MIVNYITLSHTKTRINLITGRVKQGMFCELLFVFVSFAASIAVEKLLPSMRHHVALQLTRSSASVVALVTLVWFFSCVLPHHVNFQFTGSNAGKLAHCASVRLFPRVGSSDQLIEL